MSESRQYLLVCEGPCNGGEVQRLDSMLVNTWRPTLPSRPPEEFLSGVKKLRYTAHQMTSEIEASCTSCGTSRIYGAKKVPVELTAE